jgi:hypothetical protein
MIARVICGCERRSRFTVTFGAGVASDTTFPMSAIGTIIALNRYPSA